MIAIRNIKVDGQAANLSFSTEQTSKTADLWCKSSVRHNAVMLREYDPVGFEAIEVRLINMLDFEMMFLNEVEI